jgi:hypothetical protein
MQTWNKGLSRICRQALEGSGKRAVGVHRGGTELKESYRSNNSLDFLLWKVGVEVWYDGNRNLEWIQQLHLRDGWFTLIYR